MNFVTFKEVTIARRMLVFLCLIMLSAALYRLYYDYSKVSFFKKGEMYYKSGQIVIAEEWYTKAKGYRYFRYNEVVLSSRLDELKDVTGFKEYISDMAQKSKEADRADDTGTLVKLYNDYRKKYDEIKKQGTLEISVVDEIQKNFGFEESMGRYFDNAKAYVKGLAEENLEKGDFHDESFKNLLLTIPEQYFGGPDNKKKDVERFLRDYDSRKMDSIAMEDNLELITGEISTIIEFNKKNSFDTKWPIEKVEEIVTGIVNEDMKKNDYLALLDHYEYYSNFIKQYMATVNNSRVIALINKKINDDYDAALKMVKSGKFQDAIDTFNNISSFRDTKQNILSARLKWIENEPEIVIKEVYPDILMEGTVVVLNSWGVPVNVLSYDARGKVYLTKVDKECKYTKVEGLSSEYEMQVKSMKILKGVTLNGPVILLESESDKRAGRFTAYGIVKDGIKKLFDFEADNIAVMNNNQLLVDNPEGEGAGQQCYYNRYSNTFKFAGIKPDYTNITLDQLQNHKTEKVRFTCEIVGQDSFTGKLFGMSNGQYVLLTGEVENFNLRDRITVIGKYVTDVNVIINTEEKVVPEFNVMEFSNE